MLNYFKKGFSSSSHYQYFFVFRPGSMTIGYDGFYCTTLHSTAGLYLTAGDIVMEKGPIYFQKDGAPPQYSWRVQEALDTRIRREGPTPWPPSSLDLTPFKFHLLGTSEE